MRPCIPRSSIIEPVAIRWKPLVFSSWRLLQIETSPWRQFMSSSRNARWCRVVTSMAALTLTACATPGAQMIATATHFNIRQEIVPGRGFSQLLFSNQASWPASAAKWTLVFLEGDGTPWIGNGTHPATDPTSRDPLAFNLLLRTQQPAWYLTRPCYNDLKSDACRAALWTNARYSREVVDSMAAALTHYADEHSVKALVLVGYSGGGVLATLLAGRVRQVVGVITIAANLDIDAWSMSRNYLPLNGSLNPAAVLPPMTVPHLALVGDQDRIVPFGSLQTFLTNQPRTKVQHYSNYDHVCCWEQNWPDILDASLQYLQTALQAEQHP